jgi:DNA-directed RNA polymerase specialized sigma24 family protein
MATIRKHIFNWVAWLREGRAPETLSNTGIICDRLRVARMGLRSSAPGSGHRIDAADAERVERAWRRLAPKHRELLRWHYVRNANPNMICRRLGIKPRPTSIFDIELVRAETELARMMAIIAAQQGRAADAH